MGHTEKELSETPNRVATTRYLYSFTDNYRRVQETISDFFSLAEELFPDIDLVELEGFLTDITTNGIRGKHLLHPDFEIVTFVRLWSGETNLFTRPGYKDNIPYEELWEDINEFYHNNEFYNFEPENISRIVDELVYGGYLDKTEVTAREYLKHIYNLKNQHTASRNSSFLSYLLQTKIEGEQIDLSFLSGLIKDAIEETTSTEEYVRGDLTSALTVIELLEEKPGSAIALLRTIGFNPNNL